MPFLNSDQVGALSGTEDRLASTQLTPSQPQDTPAAPSVGDVFSAGFHQGNNLTMAAIDRITNPDSNAPAQPGYDASLDLHGYEDQSDRFLRSTSPAQTQVIKNRIDAENAAQSTIARSGGLGVAASIAGSLLDPVTIASYALAPELQAPRLARFAYGLAVGAAAGEAQQYAINQVQGTDYSPSALRIGGNALLMGVLGSIAKSVPKTEFDPLAARVGAEINRPPSESTAGAQQVPTTTLQQETISRGGETLAKTAGLVSPTARLMTGPSLEARRLAQQLTDTNYLTNKNFEDIATPPNVESIVGQNVGIRQYELARGFDAAFSDYKSGGGTLDRTAFSAEVSHAMRNEDVSAIPQVSKIASDTRALFSSDRAAFAAHGVMPEGTEVLGGKSYFPRAFDQEAIAANPVDFKQRLTSWYTEHPKLDENGLAVAREPAEVTAAVNSTMDKIQGIARGQVDLGQSIKSPKALKERVLDAPDSLLEPYLSSDFEHVMHNYHNTIVPQLEMRNYFGSTALEAEFQKVTDEFGRLKEGLTDPKAIAKLNAQQRTTLDLLDGLRERVLGSAGPKGNESTWWVRASKPIMALNYTRMLGGMVVSAASDIARPVIRYGLINTMTRAAQFLSTYIVPGEGSLNALTRADSKRMGTALDWYVHTRAKSLGSLGDDMGSSLDKLTNNFTRMSGMATFDSSLRNITSILEQDAIHRAVFSGNLSTLERAKLAQHGITSADYPILREQWEKFGSNEQGLNRARTDLWTDREAAGKIEQAVYRAGQSVAYAIGKGDLALMMNKPVYRALLQFKSFVISAATRLTIPLAQGLAHGDVKAAAGLGVGLTIGAMQYVLKENIAGRKPDLSPGRLAMEAASNSGFLNYLPDIWDATTRITHLPSFSRFGNMSGPEAFLGPTYGTITSLSDLLSKATAAKNLSYQDIKKLRQLLPYNNVFYLRTLVNAIEGKTADAIGAKNAPHKNFADYFDPSKFDEPAAPKNSAHLLGQGEIPNAL